jgi:hypothetical protein
MTPRDGAGNVGTGALHEKSGARDRVTIGDKATFALAHKPHET